MKGLLWIVVVLVVVGGALKMAGIDLPIIDYPLGPIGVFDGRGPAMPDIQIQPPGFGEFPAP
ncbi:MAG: hypothetical protein ACR2I5_03760 [Candidatus Limnocylindria bacterium]